MIRRAIASSSSSNASSKSSTHLYQEAQDEIMEFVSTTLADYNPSDDLIYQKFKAALNKTINIEGLGTNSLISFGFIGSAASS